MAYVTIGGKVEFDVEVDEGLSKEEKRKQAREKIRGFDRKIGRGNELVNFDEQYIYI